MLFVDYEANYAIIEMIGEWNDAIENDIMSLKRNLIDYLTVKGIYKFVFITENVLNYHSGDTDYYEEWTEEINEENGWIVLLNMPEQTKYDFLHSKIKKYLFFYENYEWRTYRPDVLFQWVDSQIWKRLM